MRKYFKIKRGLRNTLNRNWMVISLIFIMLLPLLLGIGLYLKSGNLLQNQSLTHILFSSEWMPLSGKFGLLPFILSSLWVTMLAVIFAAPICLLAAIYLTQYAHRNLLKIMHPVIDILSGIPSVVFGVWGILIVVPLVSRYIAPFFGYQSSGFTVLAGAIVLAIMIIPFMLNILVDVLKTIPEEYTEVSLSLGATRWQTVKKVLLRKAFPGIVSAIGLGLSRAFGETIAVLMVVGNVVHTPKGLFSPGYPLPALIANNYGEMLSIPLYESALMLAALVLFVVVLLFNLASRLAIIRLEENS